MTDSAVLAPRVDGVVIVAAYGQVTFEAAGNVKALLERVNARILGVILNRIPVSEAGGGYYYYYEEDSPTIDSPQSTREAEARA